MSSRQIIIRALNPMEEALTISNEAFPLSVVSVLHLKNGPKIETLQSALTQLQSRHLLLQAGILKKRGSYSFYQLNAVPLIPLKVISRNHEKSWRKEAEELLNTSFGRKGPLMKCRYLSALDGTDCELIVCFHHALIDGNSARLILHELLCLVAEIPLMEKIDDDASVGMPSANRHRTTWSQLGRWVHRQIVDEWNYYRKGISSPTPAGSQNATLSFRLTGDLSRRLMVKIARRGFTLNTILTAAILQSTVKPKNIGKAKALARVITFFDLRTSVKPEIAAQNLGCIISMLRMSIPVTNENTIWQLGAHVKNRIFQARRRGEVFLMAWISKYLIKMTLRLPSPRLGVSALSFIGKLDLNPMYGNIQLSDMKVFITNNRHGPEISAVGKNLHGRIGLDFTYLTSEMNATQASQIIEDVQASLEKIAEFP